MLISEAFARYDQELLADGKALKTRKNYRTAMRSFIRCCGDIPVELLSFDALKRWQLYESSRGAQQSSIKANLCTFRSVFKWLRRQGHQVIDFRDIDLPRVGQREPVWLDWNEVQQLLEVISSPRDKAIVAALFGSGARIGELLQLNRDSIVDGEATIIGKGSKVAPLYFDKTSLRYINEYLETRRDTLTPLFVSGQYRRITVSRVEQLVHIYADQAGLDKNVTPHVLRHSFASDLKQNGADLYEVQQALRHSQISTTQIYTHIKDKKRKEIHQKFHTDESRAVLAGGGVRFRLNKLWVEHFMPTPFRKVVETIMHPGQGMIVGYETFLTGFRGIIRAE
jgi:integrase/recombinase XerD